MKIRKILLIDADSKIPNLALMKLSTYHKSKGDNVKLVQLHIPFFNYRRHKGYILPTNYDKIYCSIVFKGALRCIKWEEGTNIKIGGSGYSLQIKLPKVIEKLQPDYSIYPDNDTSYGFITRGCIRKCYFCIVPEKEGIIHQVATISEIVKHEQTKFLDNNILAFSGHKEILQELIDKHIKCEFNQGLDIRLLDEENSELLRQIKYTSQYSFAFDNWSYLKSIEKGLKLLSWRKPWQIRFFVYCNDDMSFSNITNRIKFLRKNKCLVYLMRDENCWKSKFSYFYIDLTQWCNSFIYFRLNFSLYLKVKYSNNTKRCQKSIRLFNMKD